MKRPADDLITRRFCAAPLHLSTAAYIRRTIAHMNRQTLARLRATQLADASKKVRKESLRVNHEFEALK